MGRPYSIDLRERVIAAVETGGLSRHRAARAFDVGVSTVITWVRRFRETGSMAPGKMGGYKPKAIAGEHRIFPLERTRGRAAIRSAGAKLLLLPKYSPDLNPIEQVFAKLKHLLRKSAARTFEAICTAIGRHLEAFTPQECANYFKNAGYGPT